jgi:TonB-linked SusC/RagA family outer membrane protein
MVSAVWAQQSITGKVVDASGEPIPGVAVVIKGTAIGTVTNIDGVYNLQVDDDGILEFTFVGMQRINEPINGRTTINVTLKIDAIGLEEVIAVGYGVQKRANMTGAVASVKAEELVQRPVSNSTELLQGQISGLITQQTSGLPGADGTTLNIRGFSNSPLIIVDGVESGFAQVDPNDIEAVSVLKDASAAIYGARAGNGVILITTKRGTNKASKITYHGTVSFTAPTFLPDLVGAKQWAELMYEAGLDPDDYSPSHVHYAPESGRLINLMDDSDYEGYNWDDAIYRNWTPQHQHNISASGGTQKVKYFVSAGFTDQESCFKSGDYDFNRYNVRSNIDAMITDDLKISVDFSYRYSALDKANFGVDDMYNSLQTAKPVYPYVHEADPTKATYSGFLQRSPYFQTYKDYSGYILNKDNVLQGAVELAYEFPMVKGLKAKARINYEHTFQWDKKVSKPFDVWEYDELEAEAGGDPWISQGTQNTNSMTVYADRETELLPMISIEYERIFGDHHLTGMLVAETRETKWASLEGYRKDILSYESAYLDYASEEGMTNSEESLETARSSVIGRINYDYKSKYMIEFAMRADASAEYPEDGRWGYFPSISAGWRLSEEAFIKDNFSALNNLKLRASYGVLGNDAVSSFDYLTGYEISTNTYVFGSGSYPIISSAGLANPNITWETMEISNVGLDGVLWDGLLGFEIDAFYRLRKDILTEPTEQVPSTFGASLPKTNLNQRDNRGFELALTHNHKIKDISYHVSPMISWSRGKYVKLQEEVSDNEEWNTRYVEEGQWDDREWGYETEGFFMNQGQIDEHAIDQDQAGNQTITVGDLIYKDQNDDNVIDWRDEVVLGANGLPNTMFSLDLGAQYKGFALNMLWQGATDYMVTFSGSAAGAFGNESIPLSQHYKYRAILGVDENGMEYITNPDDFKLPPVLEGGRSSNNSESNDFYKYDATYFRLKNINFSYTLPGKLVEKAGLSNCMVYFSGSNLLSFSNLGIWKDNFDPEITGANNRDYPPVKTLTFGLKVTL